MKYSQLFGADALVMADAKGNKETFAYVAPVKEGQAIQALQTEVQGRGSVTAASLSLICTIFDHPRFDGYSGKIAIGERMPKELKAAIREREEAVLLPLFSDYYDAKNKADAKAAATNPKHPYHGSKALAWDQFIGALREGGIYGNVKSYAMQYMAYFGMLPCVYTEGKPDNSRYQPDSPLANLTANAKTDKTSEDDGIAGTLVTLASEVANRNEKTAMGDTITAIAALKAMLAKYEELAREEAERLTEQVGLRPNPEVKPTDVATEGHAVITKAKRQRKAKEEKAEAAAPF